MRRHRARALLRLLGWFAAGCLLALCAAFIVRRLPTPAILEPPPPRPLGFTVGAHEYTLSLPGAETGEPVWDEPDTRALRVRSCVRIPVLQEGLSAGSVTLTFDESPEGTIFYLRAQCRVPLTATLTVSDAPALNLRAIPFMESAVPDAGPVRWGAAYDADSALFLEGEGLGLYLSRTAALTGLGSTVYTRAVPAEGVTLLRDAETGALTASIPLTAGDTIVSGGATPGPLVYWEAKDAAFATILLSASDTDYHLMADGVYITMPDSYRPHDGTDAPHIYRTSTAWLLGPCTYETNGPLYTALGKSIVYSYLDHVNGTGFIPTPPASTWLMGDYGIGGGFYDTRFNFDTMKRLMAAEQAWHDPAIGETVHRMVRFFLSYSEGNRFTVDGVPFVPDYGYPEPKTDADPSPFSRTTAAASLNHYLTEGLLLLRAGEAYDDPDATARGFEIVQAVSDSADLWIRENGDLWYAIRPDGQTEKDDYVNVTYLDLIDASALLHKLGVWDKYPGVQRLLDSKEQWLRDTGNATLTTPHVPFTYR